jgi:DNA repair protein RecO (recombination protein O)
MFQKTEGIVLDYTRYGESSVIVNIFTREAGMKSYIVNGVFGKKKKDKFILLQPLNLLELEVYNRQNQSIQRIKDFRIKRTHEQIPFSQDRRAQAFFITEILSNILRNENTNHQLFDFLAEAIIFLDTGNKGIENFHILFLFELTAFLGFLPDGKNAEIFNYFDLIEGCFSNNDTKHPFFLSVDETKLFSRLFAIKRENLSELAKNVIERKNLLKSIIALYENHFPGALNIKSIDVLGDLF